MSCAIKMTIYDRSGKEIESRLFNDLLSNTSREKAVAIYEYVVSPEFKLNSLFPTDENGEFLTGPILVLSNLISKEDYINLLDLLQGRFKNGKVVDYTMEEAREIVKEFNYKNPLNSLFHMVSNLSTNGKYHVKVYEGGHKYYSADVSNKNIKSIEEDYNSLVNDIIRKLATKYGISIGALTNLEKLLKISGVMDTNVAKVTSNGLLECIRLADGVKGEKALPEEFAHFIVEALGEDHPLINRFLNFIVDKLLISEILGDAYNTYKQQYKDNELILAKEALGKLIAKHFLNLDIIPQTEYKPLLQRIINSIKLFFLKLSTLGFLKELSNSLLLLSSEVKVLSTNILSDKLAGDINLLNLKSNSIQLYDLTERVKELERIANKILETKVKSSKILQKRNLNKVDRYEEAEKLNELQDLIDSKDYNAAITTFTLNACEELKVHQQTIKKILDGTSGATELNLIGGMLRSVKNFVSSYGVIVEDLNNELVKDEWEETSQFSDDFKKSLTELEKLCKYLNVQVDTIRQELLLDFFRPYFGDEITIALGKNKGKKLTLEEVLTHANKDISFAERFLDAMADSKSDLLRLFANVVDDFKYKALQDTLNYMKLILDLDVLLKKSGIKDTSFMFKRINGLITHDYIDIIDNEKFEKAKDSFKRSLGDEANNLLSDKFYKWYQANTELFNGKTIPKRSLYGSKEYNKLSQALKDYYDNIIVIKKELDNIVGNENHNRAVLIHKDLIERIKSSKNIKGGLETVKESIKDLFVKRKQDESFGGDESSKSNTLIDFEGNKITTLPIYFVKKVDNVNDLSLDVSSSMIAYASMAMDFKLMDSIIHLLELTRDLIKDKNAFKIDETEGDKSLTQIIKGYGMEFSNKLVKNTESSNLLARFNAYMDMQVYGKYKDDEGNFGNTNISKAKTADFINRMTALNNLALNALAGVSNVNTGAVMMLEEAIANLYFNMKDLIKADKRYIEMFPEMLANIGSNNRKDKMSLILERFNVMQDYEGRMREIQMDLGRLTKLMNSSPLFFLSRCGEHWMQTRTFLSLASSYKMKSPDGKIVDLFDALEVIDVNKNTKKIDIKKGYTKENGEQFTEKDFESLSRRSQYINGKLHGIYNKSDMNVILRYALGRMAYIFRKWMRSAYIRRVSQATYSYQAQDWNEGYYNTFGRFALNLLKDIKSLLFNIVRDYKNLSRVEKANMRRAITELSVFISLSTVLAFAKFSDDDDEWFAQFMEYQLRRLLTEIGAMTPTPSIFLQAFTILKSPAAGVDYLLKISNVFDVLDYGDEVTSGRYKGMLKGEKFWLELVPMNRTIYKSLNPKEASSFFKSSN